MSGEIEIGKWITLSTILIEKFMTFQSYQEKKEYSFTKANDTNGIPS